LPHAPSTLPPGQRAVAGFPRFGTQSIRPAPPVPRGPRLEVDGAGVIPFAVPLADLAEGLARREQLSDLHCVAGWSAVRLRWEGVPFVEFWRHRVEPALPSGVLVSHVVLEGLDGYLIPAAVEDLLGDDLLLADRLNGQPLAGTTADRYAW